MLGRARPRDAGRAGAWPQVERELLVENTITLPVQINGKKRADVTVARDAAKRRNRGCRSGARCGKKGARRQGAEEGDRRAATDRQCGGVNRASWRRLAAGPARRRACRGGPDRRLLPAALRHASFARRGQRARQACRDRRCRRSIAPNGTPTARVAVALRNALQFDLTGGGAAAPVRADLSRSRSASRTSQYTVVIDPTSGRPDAQIDRVDGALTADRDRDRQSRGQATRPSPHVDYDIPGSQQRFASSARSATPRTAPSRWSPRRSGTGWRRISSPD